MADQQQQVSVTDLLAIIQAQQDSINATNAAMQQLQQEAQDERVRIQQERNQALAAKQQMLNEIAVAQQIGGIYGYNNGNPLTAAERQFHTLIKGLGVNEPTADELFRQGITGIDSIKTMTDDNLKNTMVSISKNKSPSCPDPTKVFLGAAFERKIATLVQWARFQRVIGAESTALAWNSDQRAALKTDERIRYYQEIKESEGTEDISLPPALKEMKKFRDFEDHLRAYLRIKRGAAKIPLVYVIRDEELVTDQDRAGTVGPNQTYSNWDEYGIRCVTMSGTHWDSDNASFWQILTKLVRDGPGWDFIRKFEKKGDGDGRGAYKALYEQAYQYSSVRLLKIQIKAKLRKLRFDGPARNWSFDKYIREWISNTELLRKHNSPMAEDDIVADFCQGISDPRLTQAISNVLVEGSVYYNNFDKTQKYLANCLAVAKTQSDVKKGRNVSYTETTKANDKKSTYTGPIEAKDYPPKQWYAMSKKQQDTVRRLRKAKKDKESASNPPNGGKRKASAVDTEARDPEPPVSPSNADIPAAGNQFGSAAHGGKKTRFRD